MLNLKAVFQLFLLSLFQLALCDILIYNMETLEIYVKFEDVPSKFGSPIPPEGFKGLIVYSDPPEACTPIQGPPINDNFTGHWIVLIKRYGCQFEQKIRNAQQAGYNAAIVHNVDSEVLKPMAADNPPDIHIPSVFIGSLPGYLIKNNYLYNFGYFVLITNNFPFSLSSQLLIVMSVLAGFCFFVIVFFLIVKYFKDRRRQRRHCLSKSLLKVIGVHKFEKSDPYEVCAICLEEYEENDTLRVLPCSHAYHSKCIDPWLTKSKRDCPVCKRVVFPNEAESDSDTETETAPLVRNSRNTTNAGTFSTPVENMLWLPSTDSVSDFDSAAGTSSSDSFRNVPDAQRQSRRNGRTPEVTDAPPTEYSINWEGPEESAEQPERGRRQRSRNDAEIC